MNYIFILNILNVIASLIHGFKLSMKTLDGQVSVCMNKWCLEKGSVAAMSALGGLTRSHNVAVVGRQCLGKCDRGPNCRVELTNGFSTDVYGIKTHESAVELVRNYLGITVNMTLSEVIRLNSKLQLEYSWYIA